MRPRTVWKSGARCGGERANVLHPHGQRLGNAAGLWFYRSPCILHCWHESSRLQGKEGVLQLGDGAEGYRRGVLEQGPGFQTSRSPSITKKRSALGGYSSLI